MKWLCDTGTCIRTRTVIYNVPCDRCAGYHKKAGA